MNYLRLQNQKIGSMKKPVITLKQPGINNVGIIDEPVAKNIIGFTLSIFYLHSILKGFLNMPF